MSTTMSTAPATADVVEEAQLLRLAAEPRRELFPVLGQARAMRPLILLIAVVPSLIAATRYHLNQSSAWQGLAAMHVYQAESAWMLIDPARGTALDGQPPLSSWLTALAMVPFGPATTAAMTASVCLGVAVLILATSLLARRCGGERAALIAAACLALNPAVIRQTQHPGPAALGAGLAALAMAALVEHWQRATTRWSASLLWGGMALGGSLLCAPLVPWVAMALGLTSALVSAVWKRETPCEADADSWYPSDCQRFARIVAALTWSLLGVLFGGWWAIFKTLVDGPEFLGRSLQFDWSMQFEMTARAAEEVGAAGGAFRPERLLIMIWPIVGLIILGVIGVISNNLPGRRPDRPGRRGLLLVGLTATLLGAITWGHWGPPISGGVAAAQLLLLVPPTVCAAMGFLRVVDRQVSLTQAVAALAGSAIGGAVSWWLLRPEERGDETLLPSIGTGIALAGGLILAGWNALGLVVFWRTESQLKDLPRRCALTGGLALILTLTIIWGLSSIGRRSAVDRDLAELRQGLRRIGNRSEIVLLSPDAASPAPAELEFLVRALWPRADTRRATAWPPTNEPQRLVSDESSEPGEFLLVTWTSRGGARANVPTNRLRPMGPAMRFHHGEVAQYDFQE